MTSFEDPELNLTEFVERMIHQRVMELHTAAPGIVTKYTPEKQTADVQVAIKRKTLADGKTMAVPILKNIPVLFPRTGKSHIHFPLEKGDSVLLIFLERNIDPWLTSDGKSIVDPDKRARFHDYNDCVCLPGFFPPTAPLVFDSEPEGQGVVFVSEKMKISLTSDGKIFLSRKAKAPTEPLVLGTVMMAALTEIITQMKAITKALQDGPVGVGNMGAPVPPSPALITALGPAGVDKKLDDFLKKFVTDAPTNIVSKIGFTERGE